MIAALAALFACSSVPDCRDPTATLTTHAGHALTCGDALLLHDYVEALAARPISNADRALGLGLIAERFVADADATRRWIEQARSGGEALEQRVGAAAYEDRGTRVWLADHGEDVVRAQDEVLWNIQSRALSVWAKDDEEKLAVTEADLEGWIRFASLCREAQGGGVLRISVADRLQVYRSLIDRFETSERADQIAFLEIGGGWTQTSERWKRADFDEQQAWIAAAALPPPMTATSLGYAEAVFAQPLAPQAAAIEQSLGPPRVVPLGWFSRSERE